MKPYEEEAGEQAEALGDLARQSRRGFLKTAASAGSFGAAASMGLGSLIAGEAHGSNARPFGPDRQRQSLAFRIRQQAALAHFREKSEPQSSNGDEKLYPDQRASFFKCLPQNELGEVDSGAFAALVAALKSAISGTSRSSISRIRTTSCVAVIESPPTSRKSSSRPIDSR